MPLKTKTITARGSRGHHTFSLTVNEDSTDINTNSSSLSFSFTLTDDNNWFWSSQGTRVAYTITVGSHTYEGYIPHHTTVTTSVRSESGIIENHNSDGTKTINIGFTVTDSSSISYLPGNASSSSTLVLTTIPRTSGVSTSNVTISGTTGNLTATITPQASFYHRWKHIIGSIDSGWTNMTSTISSATNVSIPYTGILSAINTSSVGTVVFVVETHTSTAFDSTSLVGSASATSNVTITLKPSAPTLTTFGFRTRSAGVNSSITTPTAGYTTVALTAWSHGSSSGATSYTTYFSVDNGATLRTTSATVNNTLIETDTLPASAKQYTLTLTAYTVDSRGNQSVNATTTTPVYGYSIPTLNLTAYRTNTNASTDTTRDDTGGYAYVSFGHVRKGQADENGNLISGNQNLIASQSCKYGTTAVASGDHIELGVANSLTFTYTVQDYFTTVSTTKTVNSASFPLDLYDSGTGTVGVGIGTVAQSNKFISNLPNSFLKKTIMREHYASTPSSALSSSAGYALLATLTIGNTYANMPIQITTASRGRDAVVHLSILFNGTNNNDPTLKYFFADTSIDKYWIYKSTTSTWQIITTYTGYDYPAITDVQTGDYSLRANRLTIDYTMSYYSAVPEGAVQATAWTFAKADLATRATNATYENWTETNPASQTAYYIPFGAGYGTNTNNRGLFSNNGLGYTTLQGTADTTGVSQLILGNNVASGTAGNKRGQMRLFSNTAYSVFLLSSGSMTENTNVYFPKGTAAVETYLKSERRLYNSTLKGGNSTTITNGALFARLRVYGYVGAAEYTIWYIDVNKITTTEMHFNHATPMYISDPGDWYLTIFDVTCTKSDNDIVFNLANIYNKRIGTSGQTTQNNSNNYYVYRIDGIID